MDLLANKAAVVLVGEAVGWNGDEGLGDFTPAGGELDLCALGDVGWESWALGWILLGWLAGELELWRLLIGELLGLENVSTEGILTGIYDAYLLLSIIAGDILNTSGVEIGNLHNLGLSVQLLELDNNGLLKRVIGDTDIGNWRSNTWSAKCMDERLRRRLQVLPDSRNVWRVEETGSVVQGLLACELVGRTRDLQRLVSEEWQCYLVDSVTSDALGVLGEDDVVSLVDLGLANSNGAQGLNYHVGMAVAVKKGRWHDYTVVHVALVVKNGATAGAATDELDLGTTLDGLVQHSIVHLNPWVLVATEDDGWLVGVKEENMGVDWGLAEKIVLNGQVDIWIFGARDIDLDLVGWVGRGLLEGNVVAGSGVEGGAEHDGEVDWLGVHEWSQERHEGP